jgi:hypothetical protein
MKIKKKKIKIKNWKILIKNSMIIMKRYWQKKRKELKLIARMLNSKLIS